MALILAVTIMVLDEELAGLLDDPCEGFAWQRTGPDPD